MFMKRGTFLKITSSALVALYLPDIQCHPKNKDFIRSLALPQALQHLCDEKAIRQIGAHYREQFTDEKEEDDLVRILSADFSRKHTSEPEAKTEVPDLLQQKTKQDFIRNNIIVIDGWVLSHTEARQCALYSLIAK